MYILVNKEINSLDGGTIPSGSCIKLTVTFPAAQDLYFVKPELFRTYGSIAEGARSVRTKQIPPSLSYSVSQGSVEDASTSSVYEAFVATLKKDWGFSESELELISQK